MKLWVLLLVLLEEEDPTVSSYLFGKSKLEIVIVGVHYVPVLEVQKWLSSCLLGA